MRPGPCGVAMASSDLDHLKISYRTRFCYTSRVPDTDLWQGPNILENIQDCFEEKNSFLGSDTGFNTNPGSPTLCSTPCKLRNDSYSSPNKECHISSSKSDRISSMKKKAKTSAFSPQSVMLQNQTSNSSAPSPEVPPKLSQGDVIGLKNIPKLRYASSGAEEFNKIPNEVLEEFYLTVGSPGLLAKETEILPLPQQATPTAHDGRSRMFRNSVIQQPLLPKSSLKAKKSLNCEDIAVWSALKKGEKDVKVSEGRQKRKQSESSEQTTQDPKQKIQQKTEMSFSTLLLEAAKRNCRNSSVLRHVSSPQIHSPSPLSNDLESSNDEFIIDESDCSFSQNWILIPNKNNKPVKQSKTAPVENSQDPERKKSRAEQQKGEKCSSASDKHPNAENGISDVISGEKTSKSVKHKARTVEKSQSSKRKKSDSLSGEVENASESTRHKIYSEESEQFLENKKAVVQRQNEKCETQIDNRQSDEGLVNFAEENQDSFHSEQNIAEVDTALRTTKSKTNSVEKSQTTERRKFRKRQNREYKCKVGVKQHGIEQTKKRRFNVSQTNQDELQRKSHRSLEKREERAESCHSAEQTLSAAGKGKNNNGTAQQIQKKGHLNKTASKNQQMSKKREIILKQNQSPKFTITRSQRISKRPSNWWVVTAEEGNLFYSPALELPVNHKKNPKPSKETKKILIKTLEKGTISPKQQKSSICAKPKEASIPNKQKRKKLSYSSDENCDMAHTVPKLDEQEGSLKETPRKKNVACSSTAEPPKERISDVQNVNLTPAMPTSDSKTFVTSTMEESGPARLRNTVLTSTNDKILGDEQECGTNLPDKMPCVRRTTRIKMKPLEYWRGERVDSEGGLVVNGTICNDRVSPRKKSNRKREKVNTDSYEDEQKKKAIAALNVSLGDPLKPTCVFDPGREQMVFRDLVKLKGTHEFCVQDDTLKMFKILNTSLFATGTLILEPFKEKGKQYVCSDTVVFFIVCGDLICTLHETSYNLTTGDIFYVPSGNFYNIKNLLNERSILLFTQIKSERPEK
ncbi:centromere protein C isoform X3 [Vombatus ursinus]|uniref:centromere protein C isoform X3 n=1 Tax=Vombatus ursinus TaxID=29139 RepID=UPI000FFD47CA|nr:centromere protein C isoform X3 [Vombatus ursinus]